MCKLKKKKKKIITQRLIFVCFIVRRGVEAEEGCEWETKEDEDSLGIRFSWPH